MNKQQSDIIASHRSTSHLNPTLESPKKLLNDKQMAANSGTIDKETKENDAKSDFSHLPPDYNARIVSITLYVLFFANLFVNVDMGILPAGSTKIKEEMKLTNS